MRAYLANVGRLKAEESLRNIYDAKAEVKERICQLVTEKTKDPQLGQRIWREMTIRETEELIDNAGA